MSKLDINKDQIIKEYRNGASCEALADKYQCSRKWMWVWLKRNNVKLRKIGEHRRVKEGFKSGYKIIPVPDDYPKRFGNGSRLYYEHIIKYENKIGRIIDNKTECVHHIDLDKLNNNIDNLILCKRKHHNQIHNQLNQIVSHLIKSGVIVFDKKKKEYKINENH